MCCRRKKETEKKMRSEKWNMIFRWAPTLGQLGNSCFTFQRLENLCPSPLAIPERRNNAEEHIQLKMFEVKVLFISSCFSELRRLLSFYGDSSWAETGGQDIVDGTSIRLDWIFDLTQGVK